MDQDHFELNFTNTTAKDNLNDLFCTKMFAGTAILFTFNVPSVLIGVPLNIWLFMVLFQRQQMSYSNNIYMFNLNIMDLVFTCTIPFLMMNTLLWRSSLFAKVVFMLITFNTTGRPLLNICTCVDCYLAVVHPIFYRTLNHTTYRVLPCVFVWILTVFSGVMLICNFHLTRSPFLMICFALSLPAIAMLDIAIVYALRKPDPSGRSVVHPQKQRAMDTVLYSLVFTSLAYLPSFFVFSFSSLLPYTAGEVYCHIGVPSFGPAVLFSAITPLRHLKTLGRLKFKNQLRCIRGA